MSPEEFFGKFTRSAWRLETLPQYLGTSDPAFQHFEVTGELIPLTERPAKQRWMTAVREATTVGKAVGRVHVVSPPLTPYLQYELATYPENVEAGEDVRIRDGRRPWLWPSYVPDFWLLDGETDRPLVMLMEYDALGRFLSMEITAAEHTVRQCRAWQADALAGAVPLAEYLATA